jgi:hypothetical protein
MQSLQRTSTAWTNRQDSPRLGSTVVAFQSIAAGSHRTHFRHAESAAGAEVIVFPSPRFAPAAQSATRAYAQAAARSAHHSAESEADYRHRMFINLVTFAWLAAVGTAGYFALSGLVQMP